MTPSPTIVSGTPPAPVLAAAAPPVVAPPTAPAADTAALQARIAELEGQVSETQRTAEFWAGKAKNGGAPAAPAAAPEEDDILETITTKGGKGLDELLAKRGYVRQSDVDAQINSRATAIQKEQQLYAQYPDLKDEKSEFFKVTAAVYGGLVKGGMAEHLAMEMAANQTELKFLREGKVKLPGAEPTKEEKEAERLARIAAQSGGGGDRRPTAPNPEDEELTAEQKHIADRMGISHEAYAKRAKAGVSMGGRGR